MFKTVYFRKYMSEPQKWILLIFITVFRAFNPL